MSNHKERIDLYDSMVSILTKMSDGNPGALTVLMRAMEDGPAIDPQSALGDICVPLSLDTYGIYGSEIWVLYKDVCGQDLVMMLALLRAVQLGIMPQFDLKDAIARHRMTDERKAELLVSVKERLPRFARNNKVTA